jgi:hypothetical protein
MIFTTIVLVCLAGQTRDVLDAHDRECNPRTAADVAYGEPAKNEVTCDFYGEAALAGTSIGQGLHRGEWVKILCRRELAPLRNLAN